MATYEQLKAQAIAAYKAGDDEKAESIASMLKQAKATGAFTNIDGVSHLTATLPQKKERSIGEKIVGAGETALTLATGATTGLIGGAIGQGAAATEQLKRRTGISDKPLMTDQQFEQYAAEPAQALTYAPRSEAGQEYVGNIAKEAAVLQYMNPMLAETAAIANLAKMARPQASVTMAPARQAATKTAQVAGDLQSKVFKKAPEAITTPEQIGEVAKQAASGSQKAKEALAVEAKANPEALKAAERLDIDMPIDVWSDSELLKQTAGLSRSQIGEESAAWRTSVQNAADKAEQALKTIGGEDNKATMSAQVQDALSTARNDIKAESSKLYGEVDSAIPKTSLIEPNSLKSTLGEIVQEVGGADNMTAIEKQLLRSATSEDGMTYGALLRMKSQIGDALSGKQSQNPFGSIDTASLKRLYGAIKNDQLDNVEALGGAEAREKLHFANRLTQKQKALEDRIVSAYGKEGEGSIATLMNRAIESGSKGDIAPLNKLLKTVPKEMHKDVLATAFNDIIKSQRAGDAGDFDFARYSKTYSGMMRNKPVYNEFINAIGKDKAQLLHDLHIVSKRITEARGNVITTGKANQAILQSMTSEGFVSKIIQKTAQSLVGKVTGGAVSVDSLLKQPADRVKAVSEMIRSQEFKDLAIENATKQPSDIKVKKFINSKQFKRWASEIKSRSKGAETITNPYLWALSILQQNKNEENKF